jgi:hypothetical protein
MLISTFSLKDFEPQSLSHIDCPQATLLSSLPASTETDIYRDKRRL